MRDFNQRSQQVGNQYNAGRNVYVNQHFANSASPARKPDSVPIRVTKAVISSLFVSVLTTFVVTFIIKVFIVVVAGFSIFAHIGANPNSLNTQNMISQFFANFGQIADFSNPLPLMIGIIAGILAAIFTVLSFTK